MGPDHNLGKDRQFMGTLAVAQGPIIIGAHENYIKMTRRMDDDPFADLDDSEV